MRITGAHARPEDLTGADALAVHDTNVVSVVRTTSAFLPLLRASDAIVELATRGGTGATGTHVDRSGTAVP